MAKIMFVLHRRSDKSPEQFFAEWRGEHHVGIVKKLAGLKKWIVNPVISAPGAPVCDGIGEMWFESDHAMEAALKSPEMAAAFEDAERFLDLERSGVVVVRETTLVG